MSILFIGQRSKFYPTLPSLERRLLLQMKKLKIYKQKLYRQDLKRQIEAKKQRERHQKQLDIQFQRSILKQFKDDLVLRYKRLYQKPKYNVRFKTEVEEEYNKLSDKPKISNLDTKRSLNGDKSFEKTRFKELSSYYNKRIDEMYDRAKYYSVQRTNAENKSINNSRLQSITSQENPLNSYSKPLKDHQHEKDVKFPVISTQDKKFQENDLNPQDSWRQWFSKQKQRQLQNNYKNILITDEFRKRFDYKNT